MKEKNNLTDFEKAMLKIEIWKFENTIDQIEEQYCGLDYKEKKNKIKRIEKIIEDINKYL